MNRREEDGERMLCNGAKCITTTTYLRRAALHERRVVALVKLQHDVDADGVGVDREAVEELDRFTLALPAVAADYADADAVGGRGLRGPEVGGR